MAHLVNKSACRSYRSRWKSLNKAFYARLVYMLVYNSEKLFFSEKGNIPRELFIWQTGIQEPERTQFRGSFQGACSKYAREILVRDPESQRETIWDSRARDSWIFIALFMGSLRCEAWNSCAELKSGMKIPTLEYPSRRDLLLFKFMTAFTSWKQNILVCQPQLIHFD